MFEFTPNVNKESMERACAEYQNQQLVADNEICRAWTLDVMFTNNPHEVHITKYYNGDYRYYTKEGYFICKFDGDKIKIIEGEYMHRACRAASTLKKFTQIALRLYSLYKCGYLE